ncbi:MAG TPA: acetylglutamate kinase [Candidatus Dormibacteraeota bacterium]|jgi:acetylglutamate kinase|nr:acetylglutamate kinase [Candidatus Dormibacteraeota bacterium]
MTVDRETNIKKAEVLVEALPYIRKFYGDTIVIKLGGSALEQEKINILEDVVLLRYVGMNPVVVHGGGAEISAMQERFGLESKFVEGLRVTDEASMDVVKMVLTGKVNPDIVAALNGLGGQAVGMSGEDGPSILVKPMSSVNGEDLGFVGEVAQVNAEPITALLERSYIPVIASIGLGYDGKSYNVNADTVAAELAVALGARKLIVLTDVEGVRDASGNLISEIVAHDVTDKIADGTVTGGMIPKVNACVRALAGVEKAHIIDGRVSHALLLELLTAEGIGTMIVPG